MATILKTISVTKVENREAVLEALKNLDIGCTKHTFYKDILSIKVRKKPNVNLRHILSIVNGKDVDVVYMTSTTY